MDHSFQPLKLTPSQSSEWDKVISALTLHYPAFSHLMYSLLDKVSEEHVAMFTDTIPVAATDAKVLMLNPETFFGKELTLPNRLFITAHELLHVVFEHVILSYRIGVTGKVNLKNGKSLPYDHTTMNKAMDYIVNAVLIHDKVGEMPKGKWAGLYDPSISRIGDEDVIDVYERLYRRQGGQGGGGQGQQGQGKGDKQDKDHGGGFCQHEQPGSATGKSAAQTVADHNSTQVQTAIAAAANAARIMGKLPAGLARVMERILAPRVGWREHLRALIMRKAGSGGYDWTKADEELMIRDIFAPRRSGHGVDTIVCAIDTSGSVTQADYDMFYSEAAGIIDDIRPRHLHVIWCDMQVNNIEEIDNAQDLLSVKVKAGGGTSFVPVFDEIRSKGIKPDALIYLTDGQGTFPTTAPDYHVIWGSIYQPSKYPFGDVVDVPKQVA